MVNHIKFVCYSCEAVFDEEEDFNIHQKTHETEEIKMFGKRKTPEIDMSNMGEFDKTLEQVDQEAGDLQNPGVVPFVAPPVVSMTNIGSKIYEFKLTVIGNEKSIKDVRNQTEAIIERKQAENPGAVEYEESFGAKK